MQNIRDQLLSSQNASNIPAVVMYIKPEDHSPQESLGVKSIMDQASAEGILFITDDIDAYMRIALNDAKQMSTQFNGGALFIVSHGGGQMFTMADATEVAKFTCKKLDDFIFQ